MINPVRLALVFLFIPIAAALAKEPEPARPLTLAFYHPWYGTPWGPSGKWWKWDSFHFPKRYLPERMKNGRRDIAAVDYPLIGAYDNSDPEVVRWHFRLAKAAGIDGFLCSWWKGDSEWARWQSDLFEKVLLPVAQEENFKIAVIDEYAHYNKSFSQLIQRATNNLPRLAKHPAYLKIDGQPVWFVYQVWDDWLTASQAAEYVATVEKKVGDVFWIFDKLKLVATEEWPKAKMMVGPDWLAIPQIDCFGTYSYVGHWRDKRASAISALYTGFTKNVRAAGKKSQLPVLPGHDNTPVHDAPFIFPRENGKTLKKFFDAAKKAKPDIIVICSWNEWLEGTTVEPARNWKDPYRYLKIIAEQRGKKWKTPPLPPKSSRDPSLDRNGSTETEANEGKKEN